MTLNTYPGKSVQRLVVNFQVLLLPLSHIIVLIVIVKVASSSSWLLLFILKRQISTKILPLKTYSTKQQYYMMTTGYHDAKIRTMS